MRGGIGVVAVLLAVACGNTEPAELTGTAYDVVAGDTIVLKLGESAVIDDAVRISFESVDEDSRCPTNVECVWAGDAQIRLDAIEQNSAPQPLDLHTNLEPREATFGGYRIHLVDLEPQPKEPGPIQPHDYSVRLAISRG